MFDISQLRIGDEIYFGGCRDGRADHGAYAMITKINRKSILCTEKKGSYRAGKEWRIISGYEIARVTYDGQRQDPKEGLITGLMRTRWGVLLENGSIRFS